MTLAERVRGDAIFFHALEESGNNWYRHRVMWAAVCAGLTMLKATPVRGYLFWAHLLATWVTAAWAIDLLGWIEAQRWLTWLPFEGHLPFEHHRAAAAWAALALAVAGFGWAFAPTADRALRWKLWPAAVSAVGIVALPTIFIGLGSLVVWAIDWIAAFAQAAGGRGFEKPTPPRPTFRVRASRIADAARLAD